MGLCSLRTDFSTFFHRIERYQSLDLPTSPRVSFLVMR
jgi:hypothetical protein